MRNITFRYLLLLIVLTVLLDAATLPPMTSFITSLQATFKTTVGPWNAYMQGVARNLLFSLTAIQIALIGMKLAMQESLELSTILGELVRLIVTVGFLLLLINHNDTYLQYILDSFIKMGKNMSSLNLNDAFGHVGDLHTGVSQESGKWSGLKGFIVALIVGGVSLYVMLVAIAIAVKNYVFALFAILIAPIILAAAVLEYTRSWALSAITLVIKYSAKYMLMMMLIGLTINLFAAAVSKGFTDFGLISLLTLSLLTLDLVREGEGMIEGIFSGAHHSSGSSALRPLKIAAGAAIGGVAGAITSAKSESTKQLKAANGVIDSGQIGRSASLHAAVRAQAFTAGAATGAATGAAKGFAKGLYRGLGGKGMSSGSSSTRQVSRAKNKDALAKSPKNSQANTKLDKAKNAEMAKFESAHAKAKEEAYKGGNYEKYLKLGGDFSAKTLKGYGVKTGKSSPVPLHGKKGSRHSNRKANTAENKTKGKK